MFTIRSNTSTAGLQDPSGATMRACTGLSRHATEQSLPVIPAERAGLGPARASRNPVIKAVRAFTPAVDYWVPARASPVDGLAWPGRQPICNGRQGARAGAMCDKAAAG